MAQSCSSTAKIISTFVLDRFSLSILTSRRGYASSSAGGGAVNNMITGSGGENNKTVKKKTVSWVPDPKTGYYMPENQLHLDDHDLPQIINQLNQTKL